MLKKLSQLLSARQSIGSATAALVATVATSRILGLWRDRLLASRFGASSELGVYFAAFRLPDLVFQLLIIGAFSSAFIPVFAKLLSQEKREQAWQTARSFLGWTMVVFTFLTGFIIIFAPFLGKLIAPGFQDQEVLLLTKLIRIIAFAQVFFVLSNFLTGILQSFERFFVSALAPIFYNLGIIAGILVLTPTLGIFGPAWGVLLGTFLHFLVQVPLSLRLGWKPHLSLKVAGTKLREIASLALPRIFGLGVAQIDYTIDVILASLISTSSLVYFNFAQHLQLLPIGLFGATIAQAGFPRLSKIAEKNIEHFKSLFLNLFYQTLFLTAPFAVLLLVLRIPATRLVFGAARFDWEATLQTAYALSFFALSIVAQAVNYLLVRAFYALSDTKNPVTVAIISVLTNTFLSLIFILGLHLPVWALGLSCSIASIVNTLLLLFRLNHKVGGFAFSLLLEPILKIGTASLTMAISLFIPLKILDRLVLDTNKVLGLLILTGLTIAAGFASYLGASWLLKVKQLELVTRFLKRFGVFSQSEFYS